MTASCQRAIHLVFAASEKEARARGAEIGRARETAYLNADGETVWDAFRGVVEVQSLLDERRFDGMEVSSWLYEGDRLIIEEGLPHRWQTKRIEQTSILTCRARPSACT